MSGGLYTGRGRYLILVAVFSLVISLSFSARADDWTHIEVTTDRTESEDATYLNKEYAHNGGVFYIDDVGTLTFEKTATFAGNKAQAGGAIHSAGTITFKDTATFENNISDEEGGAIFNGGTVTFNGESVFKNNSSTEWQGGAIYNEGEIIFSDKATFENNISDDVGGAIYNYDTLMFNDTATFINNSASADQGGAIYNDFDGALTFNGESIFTNNSSAEYQGGAIYNYSGGTITFKDTATFESNTSGSDGGAIYSEDGGTITFEKTAIFTGNKSINDRAGALSTFGVVNFNGVATFYGNTSGSDGGAIYNGSGGTITFKDTATFESNTSGGDGGAIYNDGGTITFEKTATFTGNKARQKGGALAVDKGSLTFDAVSAGQDAYDNNFIDNRAEGQGGAVVIDTTNNQQASSASFVLKGKTLFQGNKIDGSPDYQLFGGAVAAIGDAVTVEFGQTDFIENSIVRQGGNGADIWGGAVASAGSSVLFNDTVSFAGNRIQTEKEETVRGGALYISGGTSTFAKAATFNDNYISVNSTSIATGGAAYFSNAVHTFDDDVTFKGNYISVNDAVGGSTPVEIGGGAVFAENGELVFSGGKTSFENNYISAIVNTTDDSIAAGGAVSFAGSMMSFDGVTSFDGNYINAAKVQNVAGGALIFQFDNGFASFASDVGFNGNYVKTEDGGTDSVIYGGAAMLLGYDGSGRRHVTFGGNAAFQKNGINFKNYTDVFGGALMVAEAHEVTFAADKTLSFENNYIAGYNTTDERPDIFGAGIMLMNIREKALFNGTTLFNGNHIETRDAYIAAGAAAVFEEAGEVSFADVVADGNYISADGDANALGGAFAVDMSNVSFNGDATFTNNRVSVKEGVAQGGAIYISGHSYEGLTFSSSALFQGNYVEVGGERRSNSIYAEESRIVIATPSGKSFKDYDGMDGLNYAVEITGGGSIELYGGVRGTGVSFEKSSGATGVLTLQVSSSLAKGEDGSFGVAALDVKNLTITAGSLDYTVSGPLTVGTEYLMMRATDTFDLSEEILELDGTEIKVGDGYKFRYAIDETGKTLTLTLTEHTPLPSRPVEEEKNFVNSAKSLVVADVRAGVAQITDRLSSLGASMSVSPASPTANQGRSGGDDAADISLWAKALYTSTDLRGATKMDSDGYGFIIGADGGASGDLYLGAALGYTHNKGDTDLSHFKSETYLGYLYGRYALTRKTGLTGTIGYGFTQFDLDAANDKFNAHTINAQVAADYALPAHLTAEIAARYTFSAMDAYTTGTTKVAAQDTHTGTVLAGLRYRRNVGGFVVKANAGALYDVYSDAADYRLTQSGAASYARGERLHRFGGEVGAGFGYEGEAFGVEADYNAQVRKDYNDQTVSVKLVYKFGVPSARKTGKAIAASMTTVAPAAAVVPPAAPGGARGTTLQGKSQSAPVKRLQISSFKKEQNARRQYRNLSKKYPELRAKKPEYERVNVKGKGKRVRTYVKGKDKDLKSLCADMKKDLKNTCLLKK